MFMAKSHVKHNIHTNIFQIFYNTKHCQYVRQSKSALKHQSKCFLCAHSTTYTTPRSFNQQEQIADWLCTFRFHIQTLLLKIPQINTLVHTEHKTRKKLREKPFVGICFGKLSNLLIKADLFDVNTTKSTFLEMFISWTHYRVWETLPSKRNSQGIFP